MDHKSIRRPIEAGLAEPMKNQSVKMYLAQIHTRRSIKYTIYIVFVLAIVIIEKENNIISRVSDKLTSKQTQQTPPYPHGSVHTPPKINGSFPTLSTLKGRLENYSEHQNMTTRGQKHILLLATARTGSSFVGQFFNQQGSNMLYLYEPLRDVYKNPFNVPVVSKDVLHQLLLCNFTLLESFIKPKPVEHITSALFRRESSSALCDKSLCSPVIKDIRRQCQTRRCGPLNFTMASESCRRKEYIAIKSVRVYNLESLRPLAEDPRLDVWFIQLVRDPRAVLASRLVAFSPEYKNWKKWAMGENIPIDNEVRELNESCNKIRLLAECGLRQPPWLRRRYMLVRYEDIARFPMKNAAEMFRFTGIPFTPQVKAWILRNTQASKEDHRIYGTQKKSSEHVENWRFHLPFKIIQVVQRVCGPNLKLFGYKLVNSEEMLTDKSVSLIEDNV